MNVNAAARVRVHIHFSGLHTILPVAVWISKLCQTAFATRRFE